MLVFYFGGAVWAAGSAIASGLFVPMLLIGSCIGRLVGLAAVDIAAAGGRGSAECAPDGREQRRVGFGCRPRTFSRGSGTWSGSVTCMPVQAAGPCWQWPQPLQLGCFLPVLPKHMPGTPSHNSSLSGGLGLPQVLRRAPCSFCATACSCMCGRSVSQCGLTGW
jgi:hypothetical protein